MPLNRLHLASRTGRFAALALLISVLAGCQGIAGVQPTSQVRVIDASPDAPALDIYQNSSAGLYNVGFGTISSYMSVPPGAYTHTAYTAGTQQELAAVRGTLVTGAQYTVLAGNTAANLQMTMLRDQSTPAPPGRAALRFLNQATRAGAVDLYLLPSGTTLSGISPVSSGLAFGSNSGYIDVPTGTFSIVAYPAGVAPADSRPEYNGSQTAYPAGSVRTVVLIDQSPAASHALQVITASDYDAPPTSY